jgi:phosphohistidine phosphatase
MIVRHGEAEPKTSGKPDEERELTDRGTAMLKHNLVLAKEIADQNPDVILSSPILRARQSAEIAKEVFDQTEISIDDSLVSYSTPYEVYSNLSKRRGLKSVMLVSHQPLVSQLLAGLLNWNDRYFAFKPATIAIVEVREIRENPEGVLLALLPPRARSMQ